MSLRKGVILALECVFSKRQKVTSHGVYAMLLYHIDLFWYHNNYCIYGTYSFYKWAGVDDSPLNLLLAKENSCSSKALDSSSQTIKKYLIYAVG